MRRILRVKEQKILGIPHKLIFYPLFPQSHKSQSSHKSRFRQLSFQHPHRVAAPDEPAHLYIPGSPAEGGQRGIEIEFWLAPFLSEVKEQDVLDVVRSANCDGAFAWGDRQPAQPARAVEDERHAHIRQSAHDGIDHIDLYGIIRKGMRERVFAYFAQGYTGYGHDLANAIERDSRTNAENFERRRFHDRRYCGLFYRLMLDVLRLLRHDERGYSNKEQDNEGSQNIFIRIQVMVYEIIGI